VDRDHESRPNGSADLIWETNMLSFIAFLIIGLVAGAIAKLILPGKQGGGWLITLVLGVVGALLGGFLSSFIIPDVDLSDISSFTTWIVAIVGSIIVLLIYGLITNRRGTRRA
jgi:uncharacterized membrane protein YeaQ/YmgE (transglycosylase-associated protein family)